jgi:hypothetical protein
VKLRRTREAGNGVTLIKEGDLQIAQRRTGGCCSLALSYSVAPVMLERSMRYILVAVDFSEATPGMIDFAR